MNGEADFVACAENVGDFACPKSFVDDRCADAPVIFVGAGGVEVGLRVFEVGFAGCCCPSVREGAGHSGHDVVAREFAEEN